MSDIIKLLPDSVANQIAAGEVIQRPASVVKELIENAVDAGATEIKLNVKDAGKTLIQVIDNGSGMSENDARMCWERHATSKLKTAEDLFNIHTKGFRGEALASMAAIAHVELISKVQESKLATRIIIEGSEVKSQEPISAANGSQFLVKNLFFNVPARRNFLKSESVETRHIIEEFLRVAMAHPSIKFIMYSDDKEVYNLPAGNYKQRVVALLGKKYNERLLEVGVDTAIVKIHGYIIKPEFSRKTRGEQYFFVNNRFIKNAYLNHAITLAYDKLIPKDVYASYFLFLDVDPHEIDVNIHPTKTEIKFESDRNIYAILLASIKESLGKFNAVPSLDFNQPIGFDIDVVTSSSIITPPSIKVDTSYNPFHSSTNQKKPAPSEIEYESFYKLDDVIAETKRRADDDDEYEQLEKEESGLDAQWGDENATAFLSYQYHNSFLLTTLKSGLVIIDQYRAHFRILFEQIKKQLTKENSSSQKLLFPQPFQVNPSNYSALIEVKNELSSLGFIIDWESPNELLISGIPTSIPIKDPILLLQNLADKLIEGNSNESTDSNEQIAFSIANQLAIRKGKKLQQEEIDSLINELFSCNNPYFSPHGKPIMFKLSLEEIQKRFEK
jgi:DNA mismatch repair protein MutL